MNHTKKHILYVCSQKLVWFSVKAPLHKNWKKQHFNQQTNENFLIKNAYKQKANLAKWHRENTNTSRLNASE